MNIKYIISFFSLLCVMSVMPVSEEIVFQRAFLDKIEKSKIELSIANTFNAEELQSPLFDELSNAHRRCVMDYNDNTILTYKEVEELFCETAEGKKWYELLQHVYPHDLSYEIARRIIKNDNKESSSAEVVINIVNNVLNSPGVKVWCLGKHKNICDDVKADYEQMIKDNAIFN
ncbi:MAG TPA: hypothetical protein VLB80_03025 [Candidatus Babeliales bacterium]|nr:hypothetical protein [Candidatus Babeliales bacterium]